jgi:hypothetical protein
MADIRPAEEILGDEIDQFDAPDAQAPEAKDAKPAQSAEDDFLDEIADELGPEDPPEPDEAPDEPDDEPEEDVPPPPNSWSKEDADAWRSMTPEARAVVERREKERDRYVSEIGRKSADQRRAVETEAMQALAQHADNFSQQLSVYASQLMPEAPDPRLLYTGDQNDVLIYQRQDAAYRAGLAQQHELQQRIAQSQQQAEAARRHAISAETVADAERLRDILPDFFDPNEGPKLRQVLESIGQDLGYSPELMAQAGTDDILALKKAAEWKDKAAKFDQLMGKRMETVRNAKTLPKMARPGAAPTRGQNTVQGRDRAWQAVKDTKSPDAMADWLEKSGLL